MGIKKRIEKMEKHTGAKRRSIWITVVTESTPERTEAQKEAAIADYKAKNPDWADKDVNVIYVMDERTKDLMARVHERTGKLVEGGS